jgi:hypothetical protein
MKNDTQPSKKRKTQGTYFNMNNDSHLSAKWIEKSLQALDEDFDTLFS